MLDLVSITTAVALLHYVAGVREIGDDAVRAAFGNAQSGGDVAQPHTGIVCNAQQHPAMVREEGPFGHDGDCINFSRNSLPEWLDKDSWLMPTDRERGVLAFRR